MSKKSVKSILISVVRIILTAALLYFVWRNAHWSVALTITLAAAAHELQAYSTGKLRKAINLVHQDAIGRSRAAAATARKLIQEHISRGHESKIG